MDRIRGPVPCVSIKKYLWKYAEIFSVRFSRFIIRPFFRRYLRINDDNESSSTAGRGKYRGGEYQMLLFSETKHHNVNITQDFSSSEKNKIIIRVFAEGRVLQRINMKRDCGEESLPWSIRASWTRGDVLLSAPQKNPNRTTTKKVQRAKIHFPNKYWRWFIFRGGYRRGSRPDGRSVGFGPPVQLIRIKCTSNPVQAGGAAPGAPCSTQPPSQRVPRARSQRFPEAWFVSSGWNG